MAFFHVAPRFEKETTIARLQKGTTIKLCLHYVLCMLILMRAIKLDSKNFLSSLTYTFNRTFCPRFGILNYI